MVIGTLNTKIDEIFSCPHSRAKYVSNMERGDTKIDRTTAGEGAFESR